MTTNTLKSKVLKKFKAGVEALSNSWIGYDSNSRICHCVSVPNSLRKYSIPLEGRYLKVETFKNEDRWISMGVHNLWNILESVEKTVPIQKLKYYFHIDKFFLHFNSIFLFFTSDKSICIDLSFWLCQFSSIGTENSIQKPYIRGIFHRLRFFLGLNCKVVVVAGTQSCCHQQNHFSSVD